MLVRVWWEVGEGGCGRRSGMEGASEGVVGGRGWKVLVRLWWEVGEGRC